MEKEEKEKKKKRRRRRRQQKEREKSTVVQACWGRGLSDWELGFSSVPIHRFDRVLAFHTCEVIGYQSTMIDRS